MAKIESFLLAENTLLRIGVYARNGLTDQEIAKKLDISLSSFAKYKKKYPDIIGKALKENKEVVDFQVENALLKRAMGYTYEEVKEEYEMGTLVKRTVTTKVVVPDVTAQIFWLKNRNATEWRDRREVDNTLALNKLDDVLKSIEGCE